MLRQMDLRYEQRYAAQIKALEAALLAQEKAVDTAMTAAERAVNKAEVATERRLEGMNEFRGALQDQTKTLINTDQFEALRQIVAQNAGRLDRIEGRSTGVGATVVLFISLGGLGLAVLSFILSRLIG
jgi:hypothetical protein